ncbi:MULTISPECIES: hypothetical protein [Neptunomonas]|nr:MULTISPECIES: hypothetical protein [Neptunomonas]
MFGIDIYNFTSFAPSMVVVGGCVAMVVVGVRMLKKFMAEDAAKAAAQEK